MATPRANIFLYVIFTITAVVVMVCAVIFPSFRSVAYAPLRELILPPPKPVVVTLLYSTEKMDWLAEVIEEFHKTNPSVAGHPILIESQKMGSREMYLDVLAGAQQPVLISPASSLQIKILEDLSTSKFGQPVVVASDKTQCQSVLKSPLVLVAWRERANALWGNDLPQDVWRELQTALVDPHGWATFGHSEWGYVKFGQTNPLKSNSGFMTILLMTYNYYNKTSGLTAEDIQNNPDFQEWFLGFENAISNFGDSTGTYMLDIIAYGPSTYDVVSVYEATAIEQADNASGRYGELRVYYPPATIVSDHPFCILDAPWVSDQQAEAAKVFMEFMLSEKAQTLALTKYGFRPALTNISLDQPGSPFNQYATNGLMKTLPPEIQLPDGNVLNTLLEFWARNVRY